jgi:hypothetical protein
MEILWGNPLCNYLKETKIVLFVLQNQRTRGQKRTSWIPSPWKASPHQALRKFGAISHHCHLQTCMCVNEQNRVSFPATHSPPADQPTIPTLHNSNPLHSLTQAPYTITTEIRPNVHKVHKTHQPPHHLPTHPPHFPLPL